MRYAKLIGISVLTMMLVACSDKNDIVKETDAEDLKEENLVTQEDPVEEIPAEPAVEPTTEEAPKIIPDNSPMTFVSVTAEKAHIREQPSIDAPILTTSAQFDVYDYLKEQVHTQDGRIWYKVVHNHKIGYISSAVGELILDGDPPMHVELEIIIFESQGNVRAQPSLDSEIIYKGIRRDRFVSSTDTVNTSDGRTWYKVNIDGRTGYISNRVATEVGNFEDAGPNIFIVKENKGNVRAQPSIDSPIIYTAKQNEILSHSAYYEDSPDGRRWYEVEINGIYGYISGAVGYVR